MGIRSIESFRVPPRWIFVKVTTDEGAVGWGESIVPKRAGAVEGAIDDMAGNIVGADPDRIEELWQRMHRDAFYRGGPVLGTAAAGIETALWDLKARRLGVSVHELLGGRVRDSVRTYAWVGGDSPHDVVSHVQQRVDAGFTAVKMNATAQLDYLDRHSQVDAVVERVASVRDEFGGDLGIALDFHGRVHRAMAKILLRELEQFHLLWAEEAAAPECDGNFAILRDAAGSTPLATGERIYSRWQLVPLLESRSIDILQPDVSITGLWELVKMCQLAEAYDVAVAPHGPNGPISLAASLQVGYCCGNVVIQEQSGGLHYNQGYAGMPTGELMDYLQGPGILDQRDGSFVWSEQPGLGISVDEQVVRERAEDWRLPEPNWRLPDGRLAEW